MLDRGHAEKKDIFYFFEKHSNVVEFYDGADEVPVNIYHSELKIRINDLL